MARIYKMEGTYSNFHERMQRVFDLGISVAEDDLRRHVESNLHSLRKDDLIQLLLRYYDAGKVSLYSLEVLPPESCEDAGDVYFLLEAYKRKVDELLPAGEIFAPDV